MTSGTITLTDGFSIGDDRGRLDMDVVHRALAETCWAAGRRRDLTERGFAHSLGFGLWAPDGATVGFCRLVTDHTFRAHLADVMVLPAARGRELGKAPVDAMLGHPGARRRDPLDAHHRRRPRAPCRLWLARIAGRFERNGSRSQRRRRLKLRFSSFLPLSCFHTASRAA